MTVFSARRLVGKHKSYKNTAEIRFCIKTKLKGTSLKIRPWYNKKEKIIKSTLELEIAGDTSIFEIKDSKNLEDWFVVSAIKSSSNGEEVASFEIENQKYTVHKATDYKCPRCWRFTSKEEDCACERCAKVVDIEVA